MAVKIFYRFIFFFFIILFFYAGWAFDTNAQTAARPDLYVTEASHTATNLTFTVGNRGSVATPGPFRIRFYWRYYDRDENERFDESHFYTHSDVIASRGSWTFNSDSLSEEHAELKHYLLNPHPRAFALVIFVNDNVAFRDAFSDDNTFYLERTAFPDLQVASAELTSERLLFAVTNAGTAPVRPGDEFVIRFFWDGNDTPSPSFGNSYEIMRYSGGLPVREPRLFEIQISENSALGRFFAQQPNNARQLNIRLDDNGWELRYNEETGEDEWVRNADSIRESGSTDNNYFALDRPRPNIFIQSAELQDDKLLLTIGNNGINHVFVTGRCDRIPEDNITDRDEYERGECHKYNSFLMYFEWLDAAGQRIDRNFTTFRGDLRIGEPVTVDSSEFTGAGNLHNFIAYQPHRASRLRIILDVRERNGNIERGDSVKERDESDNTHEIGRSLPDLAIEPRISRLSRDLLSLQVLNIGEGAISSQLPVDFKMWWVGSDPSSAITLSRTLADQVHAFLPGEVKTIEWAQASGRPVSELFEYIRRPPTADAELEVVVDANNIMLETVEDNNTEQLQFALPDLVIENQELSNSSLNFRVYNRGEEVVTERQRIPLTLEWLNEEGIVVSAPGQGVSHAISVAGNIRVDLSEPISIIKQPGVSTPSTRFLFDQVPVHAVALKITVDPENNILESNNDNNIVRAHRPLPDLTISAAVLSEEGMRATIYNRGSSRATSPIELLLEWLDGEAQEVRSATFLYQGAALVPEGDFVFDSQDGESIPDEVRRYISNRPQGATRLRLTVDPRDAIFEQRNNNNTVETVLLQDETTSEELVRHDDDEAINEAIQTITSDALETPASETTPEGTDDTDETSSEERREDQQEVSDPIVLPGNPLYIFKEAGRDVRMFFNTDPEKKAELHLKYANDKLRETKKLAKQEKHERVARHLKNYEKELEKLEELTSSLAEEKSDVAERLTRQSLQAQLSHQVLIGSFELGAKGETIQDVKDARTKTLERLGKTIALVETPEKAASIMNSTLNRTITPFGALRSLEVLKAVEERVPFSAKEAIQNVQEDTLVRFKNQLETLPETQQKLFSEYVNKIGGDDVFYIKTVNALTKTGVDEKVSDELVKTRNVLFNKIENRLEEAATEDLAIAEKILSTVTDGDVDSFRVLKDIEQNIDPKFEKVISEVKKEAVNNFRVKYQDGEKFSETALEFNDIKQLAVLEELKKNIPENAREKIIDAQKIIAQNIEQKLKSGNESERKMAIHSITDDNAESLEIIDKTFAAKKDIREALLKGQAENIEKKEKEAQYTRNVEVSKQKIESDTAVQTLMKQESPGPIEKVETKIAPAQPPATEIPVCPKDYVPVCGTDGKTYTNKCFAGIAKVAVVYSGECKAVIPPQAVCPTDYKPACGSDGKTYTNDCLAKQAKASIQYYGECKMITTPAVAVCPSDYKPVCGSDDKTYTNDCMLKKVNVSLQYYGECTAATPPPTVSTTGTLPDFVVEPPSFLPSTLFAGDRMEFSALLRNQGSVGAGSSMAQLRIDVGNDGTWDVFPAKSGVLSMSYGGITSSLTLGWKEDVYVPPPWIAVVGTHKFEICADVANQVTESNENNNCVSKVFTVAEKTFEYSEYIVSDSSMSPASPAVGDKISFAGIISNQGPGSATNSSSARLRIDIGSDGTWDITASDVLTNAIAVGGIAKINWALVWTATAGNHMYEICADILNQVIESSERNNCAREAFIIGSVTTPQPVLLPPPTYQCGDGLDNDKDGYIDLKDPGCIDSQDNDETNVVTTTTTPPPAPTTVVYQCNDGIDNDKDGYIDLKDPGCIDSQDNDETNTVTKPDYYISSQSMAPTVPAAGDLVSFSATVFNSGSFGTGSSFTRLRIDVGSDGSWDITPSDIFVDALAQSGSKTVLWSKVWTPKSGIHKYEICADNGNLISESNETNNCVSATLTIK